MRYQIELGHSLSYHRDQGDWRWVGMLWASLFKKHPWQTPPNSPSCGLFVWKGLCSYESELPSVYGYSIPWQVLSRLSLADSSNLPYLCYRDCSDALDDLYRAIFCCLDSGDSSVWSPLQIDLEKLVLDDRSGVVAWRHFKGLAVRSLFKGLSGWDMSLSTGTRYEILD